MAFVLPNKKITPIPDTEPDAVPALWNTRYDEIDANFARIAGFNPVGVCSTAAATAAKTVECENFTLANYSLITVLFTVTNSAQSPTLNVNGTGAKPIKMRGAAIRANLLATGRAYAFLYDGASWCLIGDIDTSDDCLKLTGGTLTGALTVQGNITANDPSQPQHVVTKSHLETQLTSLSSTVGNTYLKLAGGTITGNLNINGTTTVKDPTAAQHPVTKSYFETKMTEFTNQYGMSDLKNTVDGVYQAFVKFNSDNGI